MNIKEFFEIRIIRIPNAKYQRGFVWKEKQLKEFWDDLNQITEIQGELTKHHFGTITLKEVNPEESEKWLVGYKFYNVIDGQQRLTTLCMLLCELLRDSNNIFYGYSKTNLYKTFQYFKNTLGDKKIYKFSYATSHKDFNFLHHSIFENHLEPLNNDIKDDSLRNLVFAKKFLSEKILKLDDLQKRSLWKKITTSLFLTINSIEKDLDEEKVYRSINSRGVPLS